MNQILQNLPCQVHLVRSGMELTAQEYLGGGGQGEVYKAALGDKKVALKWFFRESATPQQREDLEKLITMGSPSTKFLWPIDLAEESEVPGFGYIMPLRESRFKGITDLMRREIEPDFRALATAGFELAYGFRELHAEGLCYRDINFGNALFDPKTGEVLICDQDNVTVNRTLMGGVYGTPRFMAPEIVRGEEAPSTQTDLFSLAVLLFYMLMMHHPLEGKKESSIRCFDSPAMELLYGKEPVFIYDPGNDSNRPDPAYHQNAIIYWDQDLYPQFLRDLFTTAFTVGIREPMARIRETQWCNALIRLRDSIMYCQNCGAETFYAVEFLRVSGAGNKKCWSCKNEVRLPMRMRIRGDAIMLNHNTRLYPHHINDANPFDFSKAIAEVVRHPANPSVWGLKNVSGEKWVATLPDGMIKDVEPGNSVTLQGGTRINFGKTEGEIRV